MRLVRASIGALFAGAFGGALVGVGESLLVVATSAGGDEYWLFQFGVIAYGALGAALGLAAGLAWWALRRGRLEIDAAQAAAVAGVAIPALIVGRYHVAKRLFAEQLVLASGAGLAAHLLLVLGALLVAALCLLLLRACRRIAGSFGPALGLVAIVAVAYLAGALTEKTETEGPRRVARTGDAAEAGQRPNVVLIIADTLRADAVDWSGGGAPSSGFAMLAAEGVVFERAYAQASWTRPSVASILTGVYPSVHGAVQKMDFLSDDALTLAEAMRENGYWTAAFTTNINVTPVFNFDQGFDEFHYLEPSFYFGATDSATGLAVYKVLRVVRERFGASRMYVEHYYQDVRTVNDHVRGWLAENPPEPFFLLLHYMDPHDPYFEIPYNGRGIARVMNPSPDPTEAGRMRELYAEGVDLLDEGLASLIADLRGAGLHDRSIVALTADHGEEFYEHQGWWHGTTLYDEVLHVPLVVRRVPEPLRGQRRTDLVRTIDLAPTLMTAAGLPMPRSFLGIDLFGGRVTEPLLAEEDLEGNRLVSLRSDGWKLVVANPENPRGLPPTALFDLNADPGEERNLAASEAERTADLLELLETMRLRNARAATGVEAVNGDAADRGA